MSSSLGGAPFCRCTWYTGNTASFTQSPLCSQYRAQCTIWPLCSDCTQAALERDIQETLRSWKELLGGCSLVLVHAPSSNSAVLFGGEAPLLDKSDPRIR